MQKVKFSIELAQAFFSSEEDFPVALDDAWGWLGYAQKFNAVRKLSGNFTEGVDYLFTRSEESSPTLGRSPDKYSLTVDCFKLLGMLAETENGREVRKYFLQCETAAKQAAAKTSTLEAEIARLIGLMEAAPKTVTHQIVDRPEPAAYMQGVRCEVNKVWADVGPHDTAKARVLITELLDAAERYLHGLGESAVAAAPLVDLPVAECARLHNTMHGRPIYLVRPLPLDQRINALPVKDKMGKAFPVRTLVHIQQAVETVLKMNAYPSAIDSYSLVKAVFHPDVIAALAGTNYRLSLAFTRPVRAAGYAGRYPFVYHADDAHLAPIASGVAYFRSEATTNA